MEYGKIILTWIQEFDKKKRRFSLLGFWFSFRKDKEEILQLFGALV